ncbi:hypothetical protein NCTC10648_02359 [Corynebacterium diphtheriae]|nr:hypothetical protein NCTC10648_02359 [Corynebacterium diphtheriae]
MNKYLASEFIASRSSSTAWLTLTALPLLLLTFTLARVVTEDPDATEILMWQSMYATGIAAPLTAMFAASAELREHHARMGGRHWRGLSMRSLRLARFVAVIACVAVFHVLNFGGTWLLAVLDGRTGANRILLLGVLSWVGAIGVAGLAMACARNTNIVITLVVFLVWQLAGTTRPIVEGPVWWAFPFAWPVRLVLPVLQVHQKRRPPGTRCCPAPRVTMASTAVVLGSCCRRSDHRGGHASIPHRFSTHPSTRKYCSPAGGVDTQAR